MVCGGLIRTSRDRDELHAALYDEFIQAILRLVKALDLTMEQPTAAEMYAKRLDASGVCQQGRGVMPYSMIMW